MSRIFPLLVLIGVLGSAIASGQPQSAGDFDDSVRQAAAMPPLNSLLIWHQDSLVVEAYFRGMGSSRHVNIKSASKSVLSALAGIAVRDGDIDSLDRPLADFLPEYFQNAPRQKQTITLRHALTMRTGLETTSFGNYGAWVSSADWVRYQIDQPLECEPGACWSYSTGTSHLLAVILSRTTGLSLHAFAQQRLFGPMGISIPTWDRDPQGNFLGGNNMALRPGDLLAFGRLYLQDGIWDDDRILTAEWIRDSWGDYGQSPWNGNRYGYLWWNRDLAGERVWFAWGYGGQFVFVVPRLDLVIATTASLVNRPPGVNHNARVYDLLEDYILPAARRRGPSFSAPAR